MIETVNICFLAEIWIPERKKGKVTSYEQVFFEEIYIVTFAMIFLPCKEL